MVHPLICIKKMTAVPLTPLNLYILFLKDRKKGAIPFENVKRTTWWKKSFKLGDYLLKSQ